MPKKLLKTILWKPRAQQMNAVRQHMQCDGFHKDQSLANFWQRSPLLSKSNIDMHFGRLIEPIIVRFPGLLGIDKLQMKLSNELRDDSVHFAQ